MLSWPTTRPPCYSASGRLCGINIPLFTISLPVWWAFDLGVNRRLFIQFLNLWDDVVVSRRRRAVLHVGHFECQSGAGLG